MRNLLFTLFSFVSFITVGYFFFLSPTTDITSVTAMSATDKLQHLIKENKVLVLSKSYCPYCKKAKELLSSLGINAHIIELDKASDGAELQEATKELFSHATVPAVWVNTKFIGGNDALQAANKDGTLKKLLEA